MAVPSPKSPGIRRLQRDLTGCDVAAFIEANRCIRCYGPAEDFRDTLSRREYTITGYCQPCQDFIFQPWPPASSLEFL